MSKQYLLYRDTQMRDPGGALERELLNEDKDGTLGWFIVDIEDGNTLAERDIKGLATFNTLKDAQDAWHQMIDHHKQVYEEQESKHESINSMTSNEIMANFIQEVNEADPDEYVGMVRKLEADLVHNEAEEEFKHCQPCFDDMSWDVSTQLVYPKWDGTLGIYEWDGRKLGKLTEVKQVEVAQN